MARTAIIAIIVLVLQQYIQITEGVTCASNPCGLISGVYDLSTGYCCYDIDGNNALCTCPNNIQSVYNAPCRTAVAQTACLRTCVNGGVCNIVNGQQVCWCSLGFSGANCEIQGIQNRCNIGLQCQAGTCYEQTIGISTHAYCQCTPGFRGITCNQCYFTCQAAGTFPDTAQCAIGRYFYCSQAGAVPVAVNCPTGQRFNRITRQCDSTYQCT